MISDTLEKDLQSYAKIKRQDTFNRLYAPLVQLFKWLCSKQYSNINQSDYKDIEQLALLRITKDMRHFKPEKGMSATSFARMLLSQELMKHKKIIDNTTKLSVEYDSDRDNRETPEVIAGDNKTLNDYKQKLIEHYSGSAQVEHRPVIKVIVETLDNKALIDMKHIDRLQFYATKCECSTYKVNEVIKTIKTLRLAESI